MDILNKNWWLKQLYKENIIELSELQVANPNITVEKVEKYYLDNIENKDEEFHPNSEGWKEYEQICQPYLRKYDIDRFIAYDEFSKLSRPDLTKFYNEMRALVRKHVGKEILNELQVANPSITPEKAQRYWYKNIYNNNTEFGDNTKGWKEYRQLCRPYVEKYNMNIFLYSIDNFKQLSKPDLIKFYNEMRQLVHKYAGKEILNELQVANPNISAEKVAKYYIDNIRDNGKINHGNGEKIGKYIKICKPYLEKYNIEGFIASYEFKLLSKLDLIKFYNEMRQLVKKHVGTEILNELQITDNTQDDKEIFKQFIKFCCNKLNIKEGSCKIKLTKNKSLTSTFAHLDPNIPEIIVYIKDRNILDSMRSLAHELKHYQQLINKELTPDSGKDGSKHENEANAFAGEVLREFGRMNTSLYTHLVENINELQITNPGITAEKVEKYYRDNVRYNGIEFEGNGNGWQEYKQLCKPYCKKYSITNFISNLDEFKLLSKLDLIKFYNEMRALVRKHISKEILNELQINSNPSGITAEKVEKYCQNYILIYGTDSKIWEEFLQIVKPYIEKHPDIEEFDELSQVELHKIYNQAQELVRKYTK